MQDRRNTGAQRAPRECTHAGHLPHRRAQRTQRGEALGEGGGDLSRQRLHGRHVHDLKLALVDDAAAHVGADLRPGGRQAAVMHASHRTLGVIQCSLSGCWHLLSAQPCQRRILGNAARQRIASSASPADCLEDASSAGSSIQSKLRLRKGSSACAKCVALKTLASHAGGAPRATWPACKQ
jgi:hypothetical protein